MNNNFVTIFHRNNNIHNYRKPLKKYLENFKLLRNIIIEKIAKFFI